MRILLVEDQRDLAEIVATGLREHELLVSVAHTIGAARAFIRQGMYDVLVLDVVLPDGTGFDLCADLRLAGVTTPILMLTARDTMADRTHGLACGANDYLTKPFAFSDLLTRVRTLGEASD